MRQKSYYNPFVTPEPRRGCFWTVGWLVGAFFTVLITLALWVTSALVTITTLVYATLIIIELFGYNVTGFNPTWHGWLYY